MAASAPLMPSAHSKRPDGTDRPDPADAPDTGPYRPHPDPRDRPGAPGVPVPVLAAVPEQSSPLPQESGSFTAEGTEAEPPLTSEPPLADATPLTSEPPSPDAAPLTSEPTAAGTAAGPDPSTD